MATTAWRSTGSRWSPTTNRSVTASTFSGHGVYTFDPEAEVYTLHWFDGLGSPAEVFTGRFDGTSSHLPTAGPACT